MVESLKDISEITCWHINAIDIVPPNVSKASGIDQILNLYGLDRSQSMGIGDGDNDIDMLKRCHIGIAMGNSIDTVKEIADYITDDIDNNGLSNALKHYGLI